jgi:hypothetical protein
MEVNSNKCDYELNFAREGKKMSVVLMMEIPIFQPLPRKVDMLTKKINKKVSEWRQTPRSFK